MTQIEIDEMFPAGYGGNAQISDLRLVLTKLVDDDHIGGGGGGGTGEPSELEKVQENGKTGWKLRGYDATKHQKTATDTLDLTVTGNHSPTMTGTAGSYSFSTGYSTKATNYVSVSEGYLTEANGVGAHAGGYASNAEGDLSFAFGDHSHAEGDHSFALGTKCHAEGDHSFALGTDSHAEGSNTVVLGRGTLAPNNYSQAAGKYNVGTSTKTIYEFGIGANDRGRKNAFEIYTDGRVRVPELTNALVDNDRSVITKEYADANYAGGGTSELEKITEGGNTGWSLLGDDRNKKDSIGDHAIDLSYTDVSSGSGGGTYGASGKYSIALGKRTAAKGDSTFTAGYETEASGEYSCSFGYKSKATGDYGSHAFGYKTTAGGTGSHAEGYSTIASGEYGSHAEGYSTTASGGYGSHAEGKYTIAKNDCSHAQGMYNTGTSDDTIHETGIGLDDRSRKNAFEIYTDGTLTAPEATPVEITARSTRAIPTVEWLLSPEFGNSLPTTDPAVTGQLWNDAGIVAVSA